MNALPIIAGMITAGAVFLLVLSIVVYMRTGLKRMLGVSLISFFLLIKGIMLFLYVWGIAVNMEYQGLIDLLIVISLGSALLGKE